MFGYDIKTLYHGSNVEVKRGDFSKSREDIDFGIGFYLTEDERMAKKWEPRHAVSELWDQRQVKNEIQQVYSELLYYKSSKSLDLPIWVG